MADEGKLCVNCMHILETDGTCSHCHFDNAGYYADASCMQPNTILHNRYVIGRVLGEGGFGITYMGWDKVLTLPVAIKEYYPEGLVARDTKTSHSSQINVSGGNARSEYEKGLGAFLKEARTLSLFYQHEGIVSVRDFFQENGTAYIVMEYVDGISVKKYIANHGPMREENVLETMRDVLQSMQAVHKQHLIHRDISTDNLILMKNGKIKIIDFGSARYSNAGDTVTMTVIFKRGFAAEEQYRKNGRQGAWTDVYGISATIYYMLTGKLPVEAVERMVHDEVDYEKEMRKCHVSSAMSKSVTKGMALHAKDRYQTVGELYEAMYQRTCDIPDDEKYKEIEKIQEKPVEEKPKENITIPSLTNIRNKLNISSKEEKSKGKIFIALLAIGVLGIVIGVFAGNYMRSGRDNVQGEKEAISTTPVVTETTAPMVPLSSPDIMTTAPETTRPKTTEEVKVTVKPKATVKQKVTVKPNTTAKPKTTVKPKATVRPKTTAKSNSKKNTKEDTITDIDSMLP